MDSRRFKAFIVAFAAVFTFLLLMMVKKDDSKVNIGKSDIQIDNGRLTPEALWALGRIADVAVSPDGSKIAYQVSYYSVEENASHTVIYVMNSDGSNVKLLTGTAVSEHSPAWMDNEHIAYLSAKDGVQQIWCMDVNGKHRKMLSSAERDIEGFLFSPDMSHVLTVMSVPNPLVKEKPISTSQTAMI